MNDILNVPYKKQRHHVVIYSKARYSILVPVKCPCASDNLSSLAFAVSIWIVATSLARLTMDPWQLFCQAHPAGLALTFIASAIEDGFGTTQRIFRLPFKVALALMILKISLINIILQVCTLAGKHCDP